MDRNELRKVMLKKVAQKITEATNGNSYKKRVPDGVIDLSRERLKRRKNS